MVTVAVCGTVFLVGQASGVSAAPAASGAITVVRNGSTPCGTEGDGCPVSVNAKGVVITTDSAAIVDGTHVAPSNAEPESAGYYNIFLNAISDNNLAVGGVRGDVASNAPPHAIAWTVGAGNPYTLLDFSGTGVDPTDRTTANLVDSAGAIAGTDYDSGRSFYWTSPTAKASVVTDPADSAIGGRIVQLSAKYRVIETYENNLTVYYQVSQTTGAYTKLASLADSASSKSAPVKSVAYDPNSDDLLATYRGDAAATNLNQAAGLAIQHRYSPPVPASNGDLAVTVQTGDTPYAVYIIKHGSQNPPPVVNSTADAGAVDNGSKGCDTGNTVTVDGNPVRECTLRAAIEAENAGSVTQKTISFALPSGAGAIAPGTPLPALKAAGVTVDGTTGPGGLVVVNGTALDQGQAVLHVSGGSDTVAGVVPELATIGVLVDAKAGHDTVRGCSIGVASPTSPSSTQISVGVKVLNSPSVTIGGVSAVDGNVISGVGVGVFVDGTASHGAVVQGNYVGSDAAGDSEPDSAGVVLLDASGARIGGPSSTPGAAPGNVFDGYTSGTVSQDGSAAVGVTGVAGTVSGTQVQGNLIGLDPDGSTAAPHHFKYGVLVGGRTSGTVIGGTGAGQGNVISGASDAQVTISGTFTSGTQVLGNLLGTDASGMHVIGGSGGVQVDAASSTTIGTAGSGRNVIAGQQIGVGTSATSTPVTVGSALGGDGTTPLPGTNNVTTKSAMSTLVSGDIIGPLADGTSVDAEHVMHTGVALAGTGETVGPNNQIAFTDTAVNVAGASETVYGNLIGTTPDGTNPLPNGTGVFVAAGKGVKSTSGTGVPTVRIGLPGQKANVISGNTDDLFAPSPALVRNNLIGTVANGLSAMPAYSGPALPDTIAYGAGYGGVLALVGGAGSVIGGTQPGFGNVISGGPPATGSVQATGALAIGASHVTVQGNDIGVGSDGMTAVPNAGYGIRVASGGSDVIGAPTPGGKGTATAAGGNVIANNGNSGVVIGKDVAGVSILSNQIHDNTGAGIGLVDDESSNNGITAPQIAAAAQDAANTGAATDRTIVIGRASAPSQPVQIYAAANCAADGSPGQGTAVLATALTDKHGNYSIAVPIQAVGSLLDATYTDPRGTSTFSGCTPVAPAADGSVTHPDGRPGDPDTADGTGFTPGEPVQGTMHSTPIDLGTRTADPNGDVSFAFPIPPGLTAGQHYVLLTGQNSGNTVAIPLTVHTAASAPRTVRARAGKAAATLTWTVPVDSGDEAITGYRVYRSTDRHHWTVRSTVKTTRFTDTHLAGGRRYYYRITALNAVGTSPDSATVTVMPFTAPTAPRDLRAHAGKAALALSWHAPANADGAKITGYLVEYATCTIDAHGCHARTSTAHSRSITLHLSAKRTYHLRVIAVNRAGPGTPSRQISSRLRR